MGSPLPSWGLGGALHEQEYIYFPSSSHQVLSSASVSTSSIEISNFGEGGVNPQPALHPLPPPRPVPSGLSLSPRKLRAGGDRTHTTSPLRLHVSLTERRPVVSRAGGS